MYCVYFAGGCVRAVDGASVPRLLGGGCPASLDPERPSGPVLAAELPPSVSSVVGTRRLVSRLEPSLQHPACLGAPVCPTQGPWQPQLREAGCDGEPNTLEAGHLGFKGFWKGLEGRT